MKIELKFGPETRVVTDEGIEHLLEENPEEHKRILKERVTSAILQLTTGQSALS